ncbi:MAG TPA: hypothetical protein VEK38_00270 [Candidatus Bathyarchaeia archaeon]|nr:hypothetical protein [Candidatus Bathyarchaeia archaeon]
MKVFRNFLLTAVFLGGTFSVHNSFTGYFQFPSESDIQHGMGLLFTAISGSLAGCILAEVIYKKNGDTISQEMDPILFGIIAAFYGIFSGGTIYTIKDPKIRKKAIKNALIVASVSFLSSSACTLALSFWENFNSIQKITK